MSIEDEAYLKYKVVQERKFRKGEITLSEFLLLIGQYYRQTRKEEKEKQ